MAQKIRGFQTLKLRNCILIEIQPPCCFQTYLAEEDSEEEEDEPEEHKQMKAELRRRFSQLSDETESLRSGPTTASRSVKVIDIL